MLLDMLEDHEGGLWFTLRNRGLVRLSPDDRAVITLVELEERSMEDAARRLGCGLSAVKVRAFRARRRLKKVLEELRPGKDGNR